MDTNKTVIEVKELSKTFQDKKVVDSISFSVFKGECFGILGPNGAGKSTTMKMMYCTSVPTAGSLMILGMNVQTNVSEIKSKIGVIPQDDGLDQDFNVKENLLLYSRYHKIDSQIAQRRTDDLLKLMRLDEFSEQPVPLLSGGMRRRLAIARGMINHPEVLFLDEPTSGLDPQARLWIWDFLKKIKSEMGSIVLTTHYMEEAEQICDRVAIMDKGRILAMGAPGFLIEEEIGQEVLELECPIQDINYSAGRIKELGFNYLIIREQIYVYIKGTQNSDALLTAVKTTKMTLRKATLSDVFLKLAGHELREEVNYR